MTHSRSEAAADRSLPQSMAGALSTRRDRLEAAVPDLLGIIGTITSQTVLIAASLYYFGWVRTHATFAYLGIDTSLIAYDVNDYILRSINVAFPLFIRVAFVALIMLGVHRLVVRHALGTPEPRRAGRLVRRLVPIAHAVGLAMGAVVVIGVLVPGQVGRPLGLALPLLLVGSVALLGYVAYLRSTFPEVLATARQPLTQSEPHPRTRALVLLVLGLLGTLWAISLYGDQVGKNIATNFVADLPNRSAIVVYSTERIALAGTGVEVADITQPGSKYRYQYSGIRLLVRSPDKYFLFPVGWQRGRDKVFVIGDDSSIRIDIVAPSNDSENPDGG